MKIGIATSEDGNRIAVVKEYDDIDDKGQVAHFLMELEFIKEDLMDIWAEMSMDDNERGVF